MSELPDTVQFVDAVIPVPKEFYSDVGELIAFITLFENAPFRAKNYIIYVDASYVVNTFNEWIDGWHKRGWVRADGTPLANKELIVRIWEIKQQMKKKDGVLRLSKSKDTPDTTAMTGRTNWLEKVQLSPRPTTVFHISRTGRRMICLHPRNQSPSPLG